MKGSFRTYRLIKLRAETVLDLKRLMSQTGQGSLEKLITRMIHITDAHRHNLKGVVWPVHSRR
jgi:hypothetical protein